MRGRLSEQNVEAAVLILPLTPLACDVEAMASDQKPLAALNGRWVQTPEIVEKGNGDDDV